jgi:hypothetical protein
VLSNKTNLSIMLKRTILHLSLLIFAVNTYAACILPTADGGVFPVSTRNVAGKIIKINKNEISINDVVSKKVVQVTISEKNSIFTAFGGDTNIEDLRIGQSTKVWLKKCHKPINNKGIAAYFEIFSGDITMHHLKIISMKKVKENSLV